MELFNYDILELIKNCSGLKLLETIHIKIVIFTYKYKNE